MIEPANTSETSVNFYQTAQTCQMLDVSIIRVIIAQHL
jgi:hypothetical protein